MLLEQGRLASGCTFPLYLYQRAGYTREKKQIGAEAGNQIHFPLVSAVRECGPKAGLAAGAAIMLSQTLWAGIHGLVSLLITHPEFPWGDRDKLVEGMLDTLFKPLGN